MIKPSENPCIFAYVENAGLWTCDNLIVIYRVQHETMWPLFRQRKQADNTSHSYDITRRSYWATENRLLDTVFQIYSQILFLHFFSPETNERTNVCGISIRASKGTAFNSFWKYKEKYNISRRYDITQPELLSAHSRCVLVLFVKRIKLRVRSFRFLYRGNALKEKRHGRESIPSVSNLLRLCHKLSFLWFLAKEMRDEI